MRNEFFSGLAFMFIWLAPVSSASNEIFEICSASSSEAAVIMSERQNGARALDMVRRAHESGRAVKAKTKMIMEAFDMPQERTEKGKNEAVKNFESQTYLDCMKLWTP